MSERKKVKLIKVEGQTGLFYHEGKNGRGKIYMTKIVKNGRSYKKSHGWKISLTIAKERHHQFLSEVNQGKHDEKRKRILLENFVSIYIDYQKEHKKSWKDDERISKALLLGFAGKYLHEIDAFSIEKYRKRRLTGEIVVKKEGVSKATINRERSSLSRMFKLAKDWNYLKENPIKKVKKYPEPEKDVRPLTEEQEKELLDSWKKIPEAKHAVCIFLIALYGGMRMSEVFKLKKERINLQKGLIHVVDTKNGEPKWIGMNQVLTTVLKEAINGTHYFCSEDSPYIFTNPDTANPYTSIDTTLRKALERVGLNNFTFHHTRHSFCSRMREAGVDEKTIMDLGGWKTRCMLDRYSHPSEEHLGNAMRKLDEYSPDFGTDFFEDGNQHGEKSVTI